MPNKPKKYKIVISKDALLDIKSTKKYILDTFKYREYAENFSKKIKIFFVVEDSTITVIRVLKDRMYWQSIIKKMQKINK